MSTVRNESYDYDILHTVICNISHWLVCCVCHKTEQWKYSKSPKYAGTAIYERHQQRVPEIKLDGPGDN